MIAQRPSAWEGDRACRAVTRHYAKTFYFASACLPRQTRTHAYRVYGFCRWVDNLVDDAADSIEAEHRLEQARDLLEEVYSGNPGQPALVAFRETVLDRGIPIAHFIDLLEGMRMDLTKSRYENFEELELYCHRVAGVVGYMMTHLFGYRDARCLGPARSLGLAMQLTNILRDIREDHDRGRIYLPRTELDQFQLEETDVAQHRVDDRFRAMMQWQIARARAYYRAAESGIPDLIGSSSQLCVRVMGQLYAKILDQIEELDYEIYRSRARVPFAGKLKTLASCQLQTMSGQAKGLWFGFQP